MRPVVLFVDDEASVLNSVRRTLYKEPYEVITLESATEALTLLSRQHVDVVVSDASMPEMSGADFLAQVIARHSSIVRIMLTGEADLAVTKRLVEDGHLYRFLCKPVGADELKRVILNALQSKRTAEEASVVRSRLSRAGSAAKTR